jgi:hypothetical protein
MSEQLKADLKSTSDSKPRGANRSTKIAGKLKVLPEQPETLPLLGDKVSLPRIQKLREHAGSSGTTGDSDDGDIEESDESQVEVRSTLNFQMSWLTCITGLSGLQSDIAHPRRYSSQGCDETDQKESKIAPSSDSLCNSKASKTIFSSMHALTIS